MINTKFRADGRLESSPLRPRHDLHETHYTQRQSAHQAYTDVERSRSRGGIGCTAFTRAAKPAVRSTSVTGLQSAHGHSGSTLADDGRTESLGLVLRRRTLLQGLLVEEDNSDAWRINGNDTSVVVASDSDGDLLSCQFAVTHERSSHGLIRPENVVLLRHARSREVPHRHGLRYCSVIGEIDGGVMCRLARFIRHVVEEYDSGRLIVLIDGVGWMIDVSVVRIQVDDLRCTRLTKDLGDDQTRVVDRSGSPLVVGPYTRGWWRERLRESDNFGEGGGR